MTEDESAAEAFARLDRRVALVLPLLEGIAAECRSSEPPDYGPTLDHMAGILADMDGRLERIGQAPAMTITPEAIGQRIAKAGETARVNDRATIDHWKEVAGNHIRALRSATDDAQAARDGRQKQERRLWGACGGAAGLLATVALLYGTAWIMPERMATWALGTPGKWDAGERLMRADDPEAWDGLTAAVAMRRENRDAIAACERQAVRAKAWVRCSIRIGDGSHP